MQIDYNNDYTDVPRTGAWNHGLYAWLPQRKGEILDVIPAGLFQLEFTMNPSEKSLKEVVAHYVEKMMLNPSDYPAGKYVVRVLIDFNDKHSITLKVS